MTRSFSQPAMPPSGSQVADAVDVGQVTDALDQLLDIQLVHSEPGKLKVRCVVNPMDRVHMKVADIRLKEICDPDNKAVTSALCKTLRKNGALLPKYGLQTTVRKSRGTDTVVCK